MRFLTKSLLRISAPLRRHHATLQTPIPAPALIRAALPIPIPPRHAFANNPRRRICTTPAMASDKEYIDFLNKANQDPSAGHGAQSAVAADNNNNNNNNNKARAFKAQDEGADIPAVITEATRGGDMFYTSDADEPFVPVALKWEDKSGNGLPDEDDFARLIHHWNPSKAEVQILDPMDWDRHGRYAELLEAVRQAVEGNDVRVYRVACDGARAEYWLVGREDGSSGMRIVGAKALAVES